jgi:3-hydroxybutyryl-CoA dehydrogenase
MLRIVIVGGGTMGSGIAYAAAVAGCVVEVVEPLPEPTVARLDRLWAVGAERGAVPAGTSCPIVVHKALADVEPHADLIVEAVPERAELKRAVLAEAEGLAPRLLASNTSSIPIGELAAALADPRALLGLHFFNPVWTMELVEVVVGAATRLSSLDLALEFVARLGKRAVVVRDAPGFATSRLGVALGLEAIRMLEDGVAAAADIDTAMVLGYRHPIGPLELTDVVGLDVRLDIARTLQAAYGDRFAPPQLLIDKVAAGHLGRKSAKGFYDWADGRRTN